jgi:hypothetical protein
MTESRERCPGGLDQALLLTYLEGGLERSLKKKVEEHLKGCSFCSEELQLMGRIDSLLSSHPEVFHPEEEELYRLVAAGEDRDGLIAGHLETCVHCRAEADMLREHLSREKAASCSDPSLPAYLAGELDSVYPTESAHRRTWAAVLAPLSRMADFFRRPMLAMGTAAALLLVAVLVIPMWRTFKNIPHPSPQAPAMGSLQYTDGRVAPAEREKKQKAEIPASAQVAPSAEEQGGKKAGPQSPAATPVRNFVASPRPSSAAPDAKGRVSGESTARSQERVGGASRDALSAAPEPETHMTERARKSPAREEIPEKDRWRRAKRGKLIPGSAVRPAPVDKEASEAVLGKVGEEAPRPLLNLNAPHKEQLLSESVPGSQEAPGKPSVGVTVSIVGPQGRAIRGVRFIPPQQMQDRYTFLSEEGREKKLEEKPSTPTTGTSAFIRPGLRDAAGSLRIEVRISESDGLYDLKADLMTAGSDRVTKRTEALGIDRQDLESRITSLVSSLLK